MTEWKKAALPGKEERFVNNLKKEWKQSSLYIMLILFLVVYYYSSVTACNNHYQDLLFNDTFLEERTEYNKQFTYTDGYWVQQPKALYDFDLPQSLNTSNASTSY